MPSTYTPQLGVEMPAPGEQDNTWGTTINTGLDTIDAAFGWVNVGDYVVSSSVLNIVFNLVTKFNRYKIFWQDLQGSSAAGLTINFSTDNLATYGTTPIYSGILTTAYSNIFTVGESTNQTYWPLNQQSLTTGIMNGEFQFQSTNGKNGFGRCVGYLTTGDYYICDSFVTTTNYTTATNVILGLYGGVSFTTGRVRIFGMAL